MSGKVMSIRIMVEGEARIWAYTSMNEV